MVDFLFALIEFFRIYYGSGAMRRNVYSWAIFIEDRPLCTQILPGQGAGCPRSTILGIRNRDSGLPDGEDRIPLCSLVLGTIP